jgi:hypothetical protein
LKKGDFAGEAEIWGPAICLPATRPVARTFPLFALPTLYTPQWSTQMMNKNITALSFASLLFIGPACTLAAEETNAGSAAPPTALPGVNQSNDKQSDDEKANKKGEESSGGNAGAQPHETEKDAAGSSDSHDIKKKPAQ